MSKHIKLPYKMLIYDIETSLLLAWVFSLGEQAVRPNQLLEASDMLGILTISYKWYGEPKVYLLDTDTAVQDFDKVARTADVIIGKNNFRFDDKRLNTERLLKTLNPFPQFMTRSDDLESQLRKYFAFPSYGLDALSKYFGRGGKMKMEFDDWVAIGKLKLVQKFFQSLIKSTRPSLNLAGEAFCQTMFRNSLKNIMHHGQEAFLKMGKYNGKDVLDTEFLLKKVLPYIKLKKNAAASKDRLSCTTCGSENICPKQVVTAGKTKYQEFDCLNHKGYAGRATWYYRPGRHVKTFRPMG